MTLEAVPSAASGAASALRLPHLTGERSSVCGADLLRARVRAAMGGTAHAGGLAASAGLLAMVQEGGLLSLHFTNALGNTGSVDGGGYHISV